MSRFLNIYVKVRFYIYHNCFIYVKVRFYIDATAYVNIGHEPYVNITYEKLNIILL